MKPVQQEIEPAAQGSSQAEGGTRHPKDARSLARPCPRGLPKDRGERSVVSDNPLDRSSDTLDVRLGPSANLLSAPYASSILSGRAMKSANFCL